LTLGSAPEFAARCLLSLTQAFGISGACSHAVIGVHMRPAPPPIIWLLCASAIIELTTPYSVRILPEVEQLAEHLSEGPFRLHGDLTPAVLQLSEIGPVVLPRMFEMMVGDRADHRVHAQSVIKRVSQQMYGFTPARAGRETKMPLSGLRCGRPMVLCGGTIPTMSDCDRLPFGAIGMH
jgi:hypothetical protein